MCRVYDIRSTVVAPNEAHALVVLTALYGNLFIEETHGRSRHLDGILRETDSVWGRGEFFGKKVSGSIALMIVQPG